jgi:hypothetical protein
MLNDRFIKTATYKEKQKRILLHACILHLLPSHCCPYESADVSNYEIVSGKLDGIEKLCMNSNTYRRKVLAVGPASSNFS